MTPPVDREALPRAFAAIRGILYAVGFVALWGWLATAVRRYDSRIPFQPGDSLAPLGIALAIVGTFVAFSCVAVFATRGRGTPAPFDPPRRFVASGPYRFVRNPMYLGAAAVIAGAGLYVGSASIILLAMLFLAFFHIFVLVYEEPHLRAQFGDSYAEYTRSVSRWLPRPASVILGLALALGAVYLLAALFLPAANGYQ